MGDYPYVERTTLDKSGYSPGIWRAEPDVVSMSDPATGYGIILNRDAAGGFWRGYVGVPAGHVADKVADPATIPVQVAGSLSYAGPLAGGVPTDLGAWWLGFSCGATASSAQPAKNVQGIYVRIGQALAMAIQLAADLSRIDRINKAKPPPAPSTPATPTPSPTPSTPTSPTVVDVIGGVLGGLFGK